MEAEALSVNVVIRISPKGRERLRTAADAAGTSLSEWARDRLLAAAELELERRAERRRQAVAEAAT